YPTVDLNHIQINQDALNFISADIAWEKELLPLELDKNNKTFTVAVSEPDKIDFAKEFSNLSEYTINVKIAISAQLKSKIIEFYRNTETNNIQRIGKIGEQKEFTEVDDFLKSGYHKNSNEKTILFIVSNNFDEIDLCRFLVKQGYQLFVVSEPEEISLIINKVSIDRLFIENKIVDEYLEMLKLVQVKSPECKIKNYENTKELLFPNNFTCQFSQLLNDNLKLIYDNLSNDKNQLSLLNEFLQLLEGVCDILCMSENNRILALNAAYLYQINKHDIIENKHLLQGINLFKSFNDSNENNKYFSIVIDIIKKIDSFQSGNLTHHTFVKVAANIIKIIDNFVYKFPLGSSITKNKFESFKITLLQQVDILYYREVVDAFLQSIEKKLVFISDKYENSMVLAYSEFDEDLQFMSEYFNNNNINLYITNSVIDFEEKFRKLNPQILVISKCCEVDALKTFIVSLTELGINFHQLPTFLITSPGSIPSVSELFQIGIEDIFPYNHNLDLLVYKVKRSLLRLSNEKESRQALIKELGTTGSLENMNIIDLIQAMNGSQRTIQIDITAEGHQLTLFLEKGNIVYAKCDQIFGPEAVFKAIGWKKGVWSIESIGVEDIPEKNIELPNETILLEGCRLFDEQNKQF
ncbi:MAG: DUF4388 domain-containing protein, partial [candidate division Zixibacteria bacterium]|nr:DUF4388 domain-containing protein [candidate division Zixibacteria bacterium]